MFDLIIIGAVLLGAGVLAYCAGQPGDSLPPEIHDEYVDHLPR